MTHPFPPRLVRASAGSGKTYRLVLRFVGLLAAGVEPRRILATTFTRKAAAEILERVLERLADAALDPAERAELNRELPEAFRLDTARAERLLAAVARALPELRVETLDAFFHRIAAGHAFELGLPPGWGIGDAATLARLRRRAIADLLARDPDAAALLVRRLAKGEVRRSVTGQVDALVERLHGRWIESPVAAWDTIDVPPPPRAGEVARARATIATLEVPLTKQGEPVKHWANAQGAILEALDADQPERLAANGLVKKVLDGEPTFSSKEIPDEWFEALAAPIALARHRELSFLREQNHASRDLMAEYDECERARRDEAGRYDFGTVTRRLAESGATEHLVEVYARIDARIDHILLDEFQDTSRLQYAVLRPVIEEVVSGSEEGRTFFCVGDVKQAIYGWRGGCRALFDVVEGELPPGSTEPLDRSWRSSPVVLDAVNRVFGEVERAFADEADGRAALAWRGAFHPHEAAHRDRPGFVELRIAARETRDAEIADRDLPFARAIDAVRAIHRADPSATVGVLLRKNDRVRPLIDWLREEGIEASEEGGNPLSESPAANRILAALLFADDPGDASARFAAASSPLGARLGIAPAGGNAAEEAAAARRLRRELLERGYGPVIADLALVIAPACGERDRARLAELVALAHRIGDETGLRPAEFVERVRRTKVESPTGSPVKVMTVHGAKGLEFDAVVLPELGDPWTTPAPTLWAAGSDPARPPDRLSRAANEELRRLLGDAVAPIHRGHQDEQVAESLSVLYVALTRAKHALHLFLPPGKLGEAPSFARVLRVMLGGERAEATGEGEPVLFAVGDPEWIAARGGREERAPAAAPAFAPRRERSGEAATAAAAPAAPTAPSARGDGESAGAGRRGALRFGTTVHRLLEEIEWLDEGGDLAALLDRAAAALPAVAQPHRAAARRALERALAAPAARAALLLSAARERLAAIAGEPVERVELHREVEYAFAKENGVERGIIDRLHVGIGACGAVAAEVIDAKTDSEEPGEAGAAILRERYASQLRAYRESAARLFDLAPDRVALALLRVPGGEVVTLTT